MQGQGKVLLLYP